MDLAIQYRPQLVAMTIHYLQASYFMMNCSKPVPVDTYDLKAKG